jgi:hypothetical protein
MEFAYTLSGGAPVIKRYMASETLSTAGVPVIGSVEAATGASRASIRPAGASDVVNTGSQVGLLMDTSGTVAATGITDSDDLIVSVIINPDAVIRARMNNGTASGTALALTTPTAADTTGVTVGSTTLDNGAVWGYSGNNVGQYRRTTGTTGVCAINFTNGILTTDTYLACHGFPCSVELTSWECYDLTTDLTEVIAQTAVVDTNNFATVDMEMNDSTDDGINNSYYHLIANNHLFGSSSLA